MKDENKKDEPIEVFALTNGYYREERIRAGTKFMLRPRDLERVGKNGELVSEHVTPEQQFSKNWMRKVDSGQPLSLPEEGRLNLPGVKIKQGGKKRTLSDDDSVI